MLMRSVRGHRTHESSEISSLRGRIIDLQVSEHVVSEKVCWRQRFGGLIEGPT